MTWWMELYDQQMAELFLQRTPDQVKQEVATLEQFLPLRPEDSIFDQCCGIGSLSIPLEQKGYRITGVDIIPGYIDTARQLSTSPHTQFHCADATLFVANKCDAAFNWWTSFGNGTIEQSKAMLICAFQSLRPGGHFLLDFINAPGIIRHFQETTKFEKNGLSVARKSSIDWYNGRLHQRWHFQDKEQSRIVNSSVQFFQPHELVSLFKDVGFQNIQLFGDRQKQPLTLDSLRCICLAQKP